MAFFGRIFDRIERTLALVTLMAVVVAVLAAGIGRSLGHPVLAAAQYAQLGLIWTCMLSADIAIREGRHIRVSLLFDSLPRRVQRVLSIVSLLLMMPFLAFIAWHGWFLAINNWQRELGASGLSYGLVTLALPVGAVLMALSLIRRFFGSGLARLFDDLADIPSDDAGEAPPSRETVL